MALRWSRAALHPLSLSRPYAARRTSCRAPSIASYKVGCTLQWLMGAIKICAWKLPPPAQKGSSADTNSSGLRHHGGLSRMTSGCIKRRWSHHTRVHDVHTHVYRLLVRRGKANPDVSRHAHASQTNCVRDTTRTHIYLRCALISIDAVSKAEHPRISLPAVANGACMRGFLKQALCPRARKYSKEEGSLVTSQCLLRPP